MNNVFNEEYLFWDDYVYEDYGWGEYRKDTIENYEYKLNSENNEKS